MVHRGDGVLVSKVLCKFMSVLQGYFGAMGCLLELLKSENADFPSPRTEETVADFSNGVPPDSLAGDWCKPDNRGHVFMNGDSAALIGGGDSTAAQLHKRATDHSRHIEDHADSTHKNAHSRKPDSLDLSVTNSDSSKPDDSAS